MQDTAKIANEEFFLDTHQGFCCVIYRLGIVRIGSLKGNIFDVSIHSRPVRRLTPRPTDKGRADCPSLKGEVSSHKGIFDEEVSAPAQGKSGTGNGSNQKICPCRDQKASASQQTPRIYLIFPKSQKDDRYPLRQA
jgi:hypothetical protein